MEEVAVSDKRLLIRYIQFILIVTAGIEVAEFTGFSEDYNFLWRFVKQPSVHPGKDNGVNILKSIDEGPFKMGKFRETLAEGAEVALHLGPEQDRVFADLTPKENERFKADIRATNILLQGLPKDIYTLINHYTDAKDIWDNVKMLLEEQRRNHHEYYVRFTKLINDMRNIKMTMPKMQLNSKFVNNMLPEWGSFVTAVKLNRGLKQSNYDQLYAYLKQHEAHANESKMMLERYNQHTIDHLALVSNVSPHQYPSQSSVIPQSAYVPDVSLCVGIKENLDYLEATPHHYRRLHL
ncbi:hypothetical protein Tco_0959329 [Tanacetum coccineum]